MISPRVIPLRRTSPIAGRRRLTFNCRNIRFPPSAGLACSASRADKLSVRKAFVTLQLGNKPLQSAPSLSEQSFSGLAQLVKNWVLCHRTTLQETRQACRSASRHGLGRRGLHTPRAECVRSRCADNSVSTDILRQRRQQQRHATRLLQPSSASEPRKSVLPRFAGLRR
jgi:hypothetical protein